MSSKLPLSLAFLAALATAGCGTNDASAPSAAARTSPDFTGVWSGAFTTQKNEFWELEDLTACFPGCTPTARAYYASIIEDPANDAKPVQELWGMATAFMREELAKKSTPDGVAIQTANTEANDPNFRCEPYGLARAAVNPLPIEISRDGANLKIRYEEWNQTRTIYMDGSRHPKNLMPTRLGHSVGRYDGDALVIETKGVEPNLYYDFQSGGGHSAEATFVERYVIEEDPRRLELDLTITDPVTLLQPHVIHKTWLATPEIQLVEDRCGDVPGKFPEGAL
ncbi:MAG TPA: hypothetical protein VM692_04620 [Gammaproteobacteria bacterium]|nr:hypothetical protein [Gammaproteobacteria bacterium]